VIKQKTPSLENSTDAREEEVIKYRIFLSIDPMKEIRKLKFKKTKKLNNLVLIEP